MAICANAETPRSISEASALGCELSQGLGLMTSETTIIYEVPLRSTFAVSALPLIRFCASPKRGGDPLPHSACAPCRVAVLPGDSRTAHIWRCPSSEFWRMPHELNRMPSKPVVPRPWRPLRQTYYVSPLLIPFHTPQNGRALERPCPSLQVDPKRRPRPNLLAGI